MQDAVSVAGSGSRALWLSALHDRREAALAEPEHVLGRFDGNTHLVVVLATGTGSVRGRSDLDEEDGEAGSGGISSI